MSSHIDKKGHTPCFPDGNKKKIELLTKEYEQMLAEAKAARDAANAERDAWAAKSSKIDNVYKIVSEGLQFEEATDAEIDAIFDGLNMGNESE